MKSFAQHEALTPREMQVLYLLICGRSSREIADILCITQHTTRRHRRCIFEKLYVRNSAELLRAAFMDGWASLHQNTAGVRSRYAPATTAAKPLASPSRVWSGEAVI